MVLWNKHLTTHLAAVLSLMKDLMVWVVSIYLQAESLCCWSAMNVFGGAAVALITSDTHSVH